MRFAEGTDETFTVADDDEQAALLRSLVVDEFGPSPTRGSAGDALDGVLRQLEDAQLIETGTNDC